MIARPARAKVVGTSEERRAALEEVSAVCSAARRVSWVVAKVDGDIGVGAMARRAQKSCYVARCNYYVACKPFDIHFVDCQDIVPGKSDGSMRRGSLRPSN